MNLDFDPWEAGMQEDLKRLNILNVWVDQVDMQGSLSRVQRFVEQGSRPHSIFAVNPEKNFSITADEKLYGTFSQADLLIPDGIGVVIAARILYRARISRVPGVELMEQICRLSAEKGYRVFFYGAREEVGIEAVRELIRRYPGLQIAGRANGYVSAEEMPALVDRINESRAQVLFLALGSPRQEKWFEKHKDSLRHVRVCQGIGGTLDTIAGTVKRAPRIWCNCNVEWLYRLLSEPKRIKRQKVLPVFAARVVAEKAKFIMRSMRMGLQSGR